MSPSPPTGAGAIGGATGSIVSQGVGVATGIQDKFSWKGVAMSALAGGVSAGVGASGVFDGIKSSFVQGAAQQAASNFLTQGIATATGLQDKFDWAGVAVAGVVGGVSAQFGKWVPDGAEYAGSHLVKAASLAHEAITGTVAGLAGAAARSVLTGTGFGDNLMAVLPDVIGSTIGNSVAGAVQARAAANHVDKLVESAGLGAKTGDNQVSVEFTQSLVGRNLSDDAILEVLGTPGINRALRDFDATRAGGISSEVAASRLKGFVGEEYERFARQDAAALEAAGAGASNSAHNAVGGGPLAVDVTHYYHENGPDGETITQKVISGGVSLMDGLVDYQERHPLLSEVVFEAAKPLLTGGPVKSLITTVAKGALGAGAEHAQAAAANYANQQVAAFVSELANDWGWKLDVSIAGANVQIQGNMIGGASGELAAASMETMFDAGLSAVTARGKNVREAVAGGAYRDVRGVPGNQAHHAPADSVSPLHKNDGPSISMDANDHRRTASWGRSREAMDYRARQHELIKQGKFKEAQQMDIDDVTSKFGDKYDEGIQQMKDYTDELFPDD